MAKLYPTNMRHDCSNQFVPIAFSLEFSMALVDHNNIDLNFLYNYAKFMENGNCGYLLKRNAAARSATIIRSDTLLNASKK